MDFNYATLLRLVTITCYVCFTVTITDCIGWMPPDDYAEENTIIG